MKSLAFLSGYQIDSIRIYSVFIQISFFKSSAEIVELWLNTTSSVYVDGTAETTPSEDFFDARVSAIGKIYRLIGKFIIDATVSDNGDLVINFEGHSIKVTTTNEDDDFWNITNGQNINNSLLIAHSNNKI